MDLRSPIERDGYVFLSRFRPELTGAEALSEFGQLVALGTGGPVHRLVPKDVTSAPPNTYSGMFGLDAFPLHTDLAHWYLPPRYFALRCIIGYDSVETWLADGRDVTETVGADVLEQAIMQSRRPLNGNRHLIRVFEQLRDGTSLLRWDETFIRPASPAGVLGSDFFRQALRRSEPTKVRLSQLGDTLVLDNWRMLHGRSNVPSGCVNRIIERAYMTGVVGND